MYIITFTAHQQRKMVRTPTFLGWRRHCLWGNDNDWWGMTNDWWGMANDWWGILYVLYDKIS